MKKAKVTIRIKQRAPRTFVAQRPKTQEVSRKKYKRDKTWKRDTSLEA